METATKTALSKEKIFDRFANYGSKDFQEMYLGILDLFFQDFIAQDYDNYDKVAAFDLYKRVRQLLNDVNELQSQEGGS